MGEERRARVTVIVATFAIVAVMAMLVTGVVAGQPRDTSNAIAAASLTDERDQDEESSAVSAGEHVHTTAEAADAPATTAPHEHELSGDASIVVPVEHAHDAGEIITLDDPVTTVHEHDDTINDPAATTATTLHSHTDEPEPTDTTDTTVLSGPIISVDDPRLTPEQRTAAIELIDGTTAAMAAFPNEAAVQAAGYVSIGDGATGFEHFVNFSFLTDGHEIDPGHIESIVLRVAGGLKTVESAMYILSFGKTMDDVPDIAGGLTTWHNHDNLCFQGTTVVGLAGPDGTCETGTLVVTPPMLHVWITEQPCGPFAGIESSGHGDGCVTH